MSVFGVKAMASNLLQDWARAQIENPNRRSGLMHVRQWSKPPSGWIKINVDAACRVGVEFMGAWCVIRDENGHFLRARTGRIPGRLPAREAEAWSLREAIIWTATWRTTRCIFELDAKSAVEAIHGPVQSSNFHAIIEDCIERLKHFEEVLVIFDHRSANRIAHLLAQAIYSTSDHMEGYHTAPDFICNLIALIADES